MTTFCCDNCGNDYPIAELSEMSLASAGVNSKVTALHLLSPYDIICARCAQADIDLAMDMDGEPAAEWVPEEIDPDYDVRFYDQGIQTFLDLNY